MSRKYVRRTPRQCEHCQKTFLPHRNPTPREPCRFCSRKCHNLSKRIPLVDRFFGFLGKKEPTGCIPWTGKRNRRGYGQISGDNGRKSLVASRVSYELFVGPIPDDLFVLHRCDNPPCVNPVHLFLGTCQDNKDDSIRKNRHVHGATQWKAKLNDDLVREIRTKYAAGGYTYKSLAKEYGVSAGSIAFIIRGVTWKHVV